MYAARVIFPTAVGIRSARLHLDVRLLLVHDAALTDSLLVAPPW
jgi:hypothetical protein